MANLVKEIRRAVTGIGPTVLYEGSWDGDRIPQDAAYRTDGRIIVRRDLADSEVLGRVKYEVGYPFHTEQEAEEAWTRTSSIDREELSLKRLVWTESEKPVVLLAPHNGIETELWESIFLDGRRLVLALRLTCPDRILGAGPTTPISFERSKKTIGFLYPFHRSIAEKVPALPDPPEDLLEW